MKATILTTDHPKALSQAVKTLAAGGLVAFPTDTVYGVGGNAFNRKAIQSIYRAKQRPADNPLPILIGDPNDLNTIALAPSQPIQNLMDAFWPGPLTLVLPARANLPEQLTPHAAVGVRIPDLVFTRTLLKRTGPLAATSANLSGGEDPQTAGEVADQLGDSIDLILDGGTTPGQRPSTVVDCTSGEWKILREGPITREELLKQIHRPG
jgi:L-threonylcarbamoyladenylate synthase